jgi:hypothetical protein
MLNVFVMISIASNSQFRAPDRKIRLNNNKSFLVQCAAVALITAGTAALAPMKAHGHSPEWLNDPEMQRAYQQKIEYLKTHPEAEAEELAQIDKIRQTSPQGQKMVSQAEADLNWTWNQLDYRTQAKLRPSQRSWIQQKDAIKDLFNRASEIRQRTDYLLRIGAKTGDIHE